MKFNQATINKTKSIITKPRKEREFKPKLVLPAPFYSSIRKGYSWCDACKGSSINVLNGLVLTCVDGHERTLVRSEEVEKVSKVKVYEKALQSRRIAKQETPLFLL